MEYIAPVESLAPGSVRVLFTELSAGESIDRYDARGRPSYDIASRPPSDSRGLLDVSVHECPYWWRVCSYHIDSRRGSIGVTRYLGDQKEKKRVLTRMYVPGIPVYVILVGAQVRSSCW